MRYRTDRGRLVLQNEAGDDLAIPGDGHFTFSTPIAAGAIYAVTVKAQPTDPQISLYREFMAWWVPVNDHSHIQFTVAAVRLPKEKADLYMERRKARVAKRTENSNELADKVLRGEMFIDEINPQTTDYVRMQDHVAQIGQGTIPDQTKDNLGRGDIGAMCDERVRDLRGIHPLGDDLRQLVVFVLVAEVL